MTSINATLRGRIIKKVVKQSKQLFGFGGFGGLGGLEGLASKEGLIKFKVIIRPSFTIIKGKFEKEMMDTEKATEKPIYGAPYNHRHWSSRMDDYGIIEKVS